MELHQLRPKHKSKKRKRVGRGGKKGTYAGRGLEGQKSRAGSKAKPLIRVFIKKYPKLRGYKFKTRKIESAILNIGVLEKKFKTGQSVNPEVLIERRLIRKIKGKAPKVKILGKGKLTKNLVIENCEVSKNAKEKIEKAGGKIK